MGAAQSIAQTEGMGGQSAAEEAAAAAAATDKDHPSAAVPYAPLPIPKLRRAETFDEKLYRKLSQEPLVPIGCAATAYCLIAGIRSFYRRDTQNQQKMMRLRVAAQAATLFIFIGYAGVNSFNLAIAPGMGKDRREERK